MCGIAGYISPGNSITEQQFRQASLQMKHRGPDAEGFYFSEDKTIGLAHRRLSVLDLSPAANQPMFSSDGRYCIIFNGEIYNFDCLKGQLADGGASLRTTSDTEVILELFAQQGPACFARMNGMFAFAIFDVKERVLTLCRDHAGIKPLFLYQEDATIIFASELKVIRAILGSKLKINREAIPYFLHLGFIPQPLTIYQNTRKFPSAHYIRLPAGEGSPDHVPAQYIPFWQLEKVIGAAPVTNETAAKKKLQELLTDAVQQQLVSDVPVGTFLSGGIDSSLVTALAARLTGSGKIQSFSLSIDDGKYNESAYAARVADHLQTDHHVFSVKEAEVLAMVDQLIPAYDEPFADASAFPTMMVSQLAKKYVTVALSGDGGDELFHGYGAYPWATRLAAPAAQLLKGPVSWAAGFLNSRYQRIGTMFAYKSVEHLSSHIYSQEQYYFGERELSALLTEHHFNFDGINELPVTPRKFSGAARQSYWDFHHYLKDDLLVKLDRASMWYSLEARVPLLDPQVVEFAYNLDDQLKIKNGCMKYLLKQVLFDYVPKEIFDRPKQGFSIPLVKWLKTGLRYLLERYTAEPVIEKYGLVHFPVVKDLRQRYLQGSDYLFHRLWLIIVLHWWLEENTTGSNGK